MIELSVIVGGILALLLWYVMRRYRLNPTTFNVWLVAWSLAVCIVFVAQVLIFMYLYGLQV